MFGEWDRALTQLTAAAELDPLAVPMAQTYRAAIRCEMLRERVFAGARIADRVRRAANHGCRC